MTANHPDILTVRDNEILILLRKVVDIGEYRKQWTAEHVAHVAGRWLNPRHAEVRHLRAVPPPPPPPDDGVPVVVLPKGQAAAIRVLAENPGADNYGLGVLLGISMDATKDRLRRAYAVMGVHNRTQAVELVTSGKVRIADKPPYTRTRPEEQ